MSLFIVELATKDRRTLSSATYRAGSGQRFLGTLRTAQIEIDVKGQVWARRRFDGISGGKSCAPPRKEGAEEGRETSVGARGPNPRGSTSGSEILSTDIAGPVSGRMHANLTKC